MSEIVVLEKSQLEEIIQRASRFAALTVLEQSNKPTPEIMTRSEVAVYLRCHEAKIDRLTKKGLPYFMFGEHPRFRKSEIDKWTEGK